MEASKTYVNCMQSLKLRLELIDAVTSGQLRISNGSIDAEFVCLQLRKALELLAFSSVAAHKEIYSQAHADFATHWNAKRLLKKLEALHADFYPVPAKMVTTNETGVKHFEPMTEGFLNKDDFVFLYDTTSEALHEWNPYRTDPRVVHFGHPIHEWVNRIRRLLDLHWVRLADSSVVLVVQLNGPNNGNAHVWIAENMPPAHAQGSAEGAPGRNP